MTYKTIEEINREEVEQNVDTHGSKTKNREEIKNILEKLKIISEKIQKISNLSNFLDKNYNTGNEEYKKEIIEFVNKIKNGTIKQITKKNKPGCLDREDYFDFVEDIAQFNKEKFENLQTTKSKEIDDIKKDNEDKLIEKEEKITNLTTEKESTENKLIELENINKELQTENELRRLHKLAEAFKEQKDNFEKKLGKRSINRLIVFALIPSLFSIISLVFDLIEMERYNYLPFITMTGILVYGIVFYMKNYSTNQKIATIFANKQAIADSTTTLLKFLNEDKIDNLDQKEKEELQKQFVSQASNVLYRDIDFNDDNKLPIDNISEIVKEVIKKLPIKI